MLRLAAFVECPPAESTVQSKLNRNSHASQLHSILLHTRGCPHTKLGYHSYWWDIAEPGLTRGHVGKGRLSTSAGQWGVWHQASGAYCCSSLLAHGGGEGTPSSRTVCVSLLWAVWQLECLA